MLETVSSTEEYSGWEFESLSEAVNYYEWILSKFRPYFPASFGAIAEVGAGSGNFSSFLSKLSPNLTLIEPDNRLRSQLRNDFPYCSVAQSLDEIADGSMDAIFCVNVLEHIEDDQATLCLIQQKLKDTGHLFLFVPAHQELYGSLDKVFGHVRRYTKSGLASLVSKSGLRVIKSSYFNPLGVIPWFIMGRILRRTTWNTSSVKAYDKFVIPVLRWLNLQMPFGQSVVVVARKG